MSGKTVQVWVSSRTKTKLRPWVAKGTRVKIKRAKQALRAARLASVAEGW